MLVFYSQYSQYNCIINWSIIIMQLFIENNATEIHNILIRFICKFEEEEKDIHSRLEALAGVMRAHLGLQ